MVVEVGRVETEDKGNQGQNNKRKRKGKHKMVVYKVDKGSEIDQDKEKTEKDIK